MSDRRCAKMFLIITFVLGSSACRGGLRVSDERRVVLVSIAGMPIYVDEFKKEYARIRLDPDDGLPSAEMEKAQKAALLDDMIERRLLLQAALAQHILISTEEVDATYERLRQGWRDDELTAILSHRDLTSAEVKDELRDMMAIRKYLHENVFARLAVTDMEIDAYIAAHAELLERAEEVHAKHIMVKSLSEAQAVQKELEAKMPFEDAATKFSVSGDAKQGGDLGFVTRRELPTIFADVCFGLKPGELSDIVASAYGFHLFLVVETRNRAPRPIEVIRNEVEAQLRAAEEHQARLDLVKKLRDEAGVAVKETRFAQIH